MRCLLTFLYCVEIPSPVHGGPSDYPHVCTCWHVLEQSRLYGHNSAVCGQRYGNVCALIQSLFLFPHTPWRYKHRMRPAVKMTDDWGGFQIQIRFWTLKWPACVCSGFNSLVWKVKHQNPFWQKTQQKVRRARGRETGMDEQGFWELTWSLFHFSPSTAT